MLFFEKPVDFNDKSCLVDFLSNHFCYHTLNPWNNLKSFANNVKIHNLGFSSEQTDMAFDVLFDFDDHLGFQHGTSMLIKEFEYKFDDKYTMGFNGRSDGYLVLYGLKSQVNLNNDINFADMSLDQLSIIAHIVVEFDRTCDRIRQLFLDTVNICLSRKKGD